MGLQSSKKVRLQVLPGCFHLTLVVLPVRWRENNLMRNGFLKVEVKLLAATL